MTTPTGTIILDKQKLVLQARYTKPKIMDHIFKIGDRVKLNIPPYKEFFIEGFTDKPYTEINSLSVISKTFKPSREYVICHRYEREDDCFKISVFNYTFLDKTPY